MAQQTNAPPRKLRRVAPPGSNPFFLGTISRTHASPSARPCEDLHNVKLIIMMQLMTLPCAGDDVVITLTCKLCSQMRMFENVYLPRTIQGHGATSIQNIQPFTLPCQVCAVCQRSNKGATPRSVAEVVEPTWSFMQVNSIWPRRFPCSESGNKRK